MMAPEQSFTFYLAATLLTSNIQLCLQAMADNGTTELNTSDKVLSARSQCLSRCGIPNTRLSSHSQNPPQNVSDSDCYRNCVKSTIEGYPQLKKEKRSAINVVSYNVESDCHVDEKIIKNKLGDIKNLSLSFVQERDKYGNVTWIAIVTWDVSFLNQSTYFSDEWKGFLITWIKSKNNGRPSTTQTSCRFSFKNTTNYIIKSGTTEWVYPHAIEVGVSIYPLTEDSYKHGFDLTTFDPMASNQSEQTTSSSTNTPKIDSQQPPDHEPILPIFFGCFVGSLIIAIVLYLRWKRKKKNTRPFSPDQENYEYDVSILYSTRDEDWVTTELIPLLETQNDFRCFIHYRDFQVGRVLTEAFSDAVNKCRKNLAIVSRNFLDSNYCLEELHMALERLHRLRDCSLIVINLDGVSKDRLPKAVLQRTYVNLTNSQEKINWKSRIVREISVEHRNLVSITPQNSYVRIQEDSRISIVQDGNINTNASQV